MSLLSPKRILSLWLRRLPADRLTRQSPDLAGRPLAVVATVRSARRITALNDEAARLGVRAAMALADARAMYPQLAAIDADADADARLLDHIADWCDRYTPLVGLDPPDGLFLDISGCAHLFGGEEALRRDLIRRLAAQGFHARAAIADTVGAAWAVARYGLAAPRSLPPPERGRSTCEARRVGVNIPAFMLTPTPTHPLSGGGGAQCVLQPYAFPLPASGGGIGGGSSGSPLSTFAFRASADTNPPKRAKRAKAGPQGRTELMLLPLAALRIDPDIAAPLAQAGLKTIGDVTGLPRAPLAARFGESFVRRIDQALGHIDEPIVPRLPVPSFLAEQRFAEPIGYEEDVLGTILHLARELCRAMERHGKGARRLQVALFRADGKVVRIEVGTSEPLRDPARIRRLFLDRLAVIGDEADPGFGFDVIRLSALVVESFDAVQTGLAGGDPAREIAHLVDRLTARLGIERVQRLVPQDTHWPEHASIAVPAHAARARTEVLPHDFAQDSRIPVRPIRLFERPEPIEAVAQVPDGPPMQFKWRRVTHDVAYAEGPESIALQWWRTDQGLPVTRDYFRIETRQGARVWLYREGIYQDRDNPPHWFLHGIFA
jgi:protein ImuB